MTTAPPSNAPRVDEAPPRLDRLIRKPEVYNYIPFGKTQLAKKIEDGEFPAPVKLSDSGRIKAWLESELIKYQQDRIAARERARAEKQSTGAAQPQAGVCRQPTKGAPQRGKRQPAEGAP